MKMYSTNVIKCTCRRICEGNIFYYIARGCTQGAIPTPENLKEEYHKKRDRIRRQLKEHSVDSQDIFANDELSLKRVNVYGFDYDFTLVHYKREVNELIYNRAKEILVDRMAYPSDIKNLSHFKFNPDFAIRGVHLDKRHGLLMKMDAYHRIQLSSVYRGHQLVDSSQVIERYGGAHVPLYSDHQHQDSMKLSHNHIQFLDSFSKPEVALFADVSEYFIKRKIEFDSEYLFMDVSSAIYGVHQSGDLHNAIAKDPDRFIQSNPNMPDLLRRLKAAGKKLFLLTNNRFVNV
jgi:HAD superfamily 5'-nucleotidase-like hydrolase